MAETTLRPGSPYFIQLQNRNTENEYGEAATPVGAGAVWADDSDASYVDIHQWLDPEDTSLERCTSLSADFPPFPSGTTDAQLWIRATQQNVPGDGAIVYTSDTADETGTEVGLFYALSDLMGFNEVPQWINVGPVAPSDFATAVRVSTWDSSANQPTPTFAARVFEMKIVVTYAPAPVGQLPRRLSQRGDGLTGGAPRLIGNRSRQSSNRLNGAVV